jgi:hypothetical protein
MLVTVLVVRAAGAVDAGHFYVLRWVRAYGCPWDVNEVCFDAENNELIDTLDYVIEQGDVLRAELLTDTLNLKVLLIFTTSRKQHSDQNSMVLSGLLFLLTARKPIYCRGVVIQYYGHEQRAVHHLHTTSTHCDSGTLAHNRYCCRHHSQSTGHTAVVVISVLRSCVCALYLFRCIDLAVAA